MNAWSKILYEMGRHRVATNLSNLLAMQREDEESSGNSMMDVDTLRKQLRNISLFELQKCNPQNAALMILLRNSVTQEVIEDVWNNPYNDLIVHIDELCQSVISSDEALGGNICEAGGVWETLRMMSHCDAFVHASVADKAFLLVSAWGWVSFEKFRMILQVFFGLNDIQILAVLFGREHKGGSLRIGRLDGELFDILEPVYASMHKGYGERSAHDDLLMLFYPYLPADDSWEKTHLLYSAFCKNLKGESFNEATMLLARIISAYNSEDVNESESAENVYLLRKLITMDQEYIVSMVQILTSKPKRRGQGDIRLDEAIMQKIVLSGAPIALEDLMETGRNSDADEAKVMTILIRHLDELVICGEGEFVRLMRVSEFKKGIQIDLSYRCEAASDESHLSAEEQKNERLEAVIASYKIIHPDKDSFKNLAEMVHAFLILWGEEIQLKDLQDAALKLGMTKSRKSISRVLKDYDAKFYSCENSGKRGFWCCREVAIKLGYPV